MTGAALRRRLGHVRSKVPVGCPACRTPPPLVILHDGDEPEPPDVCSQCGRRLSGIRVVRIVRVERGPQ
jgi:hypothetical protein